ncbi:MAG: Rrf2 family transcriptional regulator [Clostridiales bacterium]|nr:Rrf2 family transcriptional regulator [Clostridiales bacterium]
MLITKETDYALRILRALFDGQKLSVAQISEKESIPSQFAYKILKKLSRAELVEIFRGVGGGYRISPDAAQATLLDIIRIIEGEPLLLDCLEPQAECSACRRVSDCRLQREFARVQQILVRELSAKPLRELIGPSSRRDSFFSSIFD